MNRIDLSTVSIYPASSLISLDSAPYVSGMEDQTALHLNIDAVAHWTSASNYTQVESMIIAQQFDQDILGDLGLAMNKFVESGQVWALIIGIVLGYLIRGLTTYG